MAKKVKAVVKLQIPAGKANPAPPVGTALGPHQINIMGFCKEYNARTQGMMGSIIPVEITIFTDQTFSFITKTPPASAARSPTGVAPQPTWAACACASTSRAASSNRATRCLRSAASPFPWGSIP